MATLAKGEKRFQPNQNPLDALVMARNLIADPANWVQDDWGEDGKHCMLGAISRSCSRPSLYEEVVHRLAHEIGPALVDFNDTHTHAEVLAAMDMTIAKASEDYTLTPWPPAEAVGDRPAGSPDNKPS